MFIDYYNTLGIAFPSTSDEIKKAYRQQSLRWHPDKNPGVDTTKQMQEINAAFYLLKDPIKKQRYDIEYLLFYKLNCDINNLQGADSHDIKNSQNFSRQSYETYNFHNEQVKEDIKGANIYAKNLVDEFLRQFNKSSKDAAKGAWSEMYPYFIAAIILTLLFTLNRACQ